MKGACLQGSAESNIKAPAPRFDSCWSNWFTFALLDILDPPCRLMAKRHSAKNAFRSGKTFRCVSSAGGDDSLALLSRSGLVRRPGPEIGQIFSLACMRFSWPVCLSKTSRRSICLALRDNHFDQIGAHALSSFPLFWRRFGDCTNDIARSKCDSDSILVLNIW